MTRITPPSDAVQGSSRHSTLRQRMSFAVPVVLIAGFATGCGSDGAVTTNPPVSSAIPPAPPTTIVTYSGNPPAPPTTGSRLVANPPPPPPAGQTSSTSGS